MNRRKLIVGGAAATLLALARRPSLAQSAARRPATLSIDTAAPRLPIPPDYTGLSYESAQLANPGYFSQKNTRLVSLVRQLGQRGVLRLGGSTSDYDQWKRRLDPRRSGDDGPVNPDDGRNATIHATITETAIDELRGFLDATGWTAIYGLDLGHGSPEQAADEAAYVIGKLGPKLVALQIGNEPDLFNRDIRKSSYGYGDYFAEWRRFADAIRRRSPLAPLAGPDTTIDVAWVEKFAQQASGIRMLTSHYYAEGPPESADADIPHLLQPDRDLVKQIMRLVEAGKSAHLPYRMSEGNSCYNGGKAGVSDAFASALWGADFMLLLAQLGVAGINFHGGGHGFYTPIAGGGKAPFAVRPLYYAMLFWRVFAAGSLIPCRLDAGGVNATASACIDANRRRLALAIINKDAKQDLELQLQDEAFRSPSRQMALAAPRLDSTADVTLGGHSVVDQLWRPSWSLQTLRRHVVVPHASALLLEWDGVTV
jgi:hypothetical protein